MNQENPGFHPSYHFDDFSFKNNNLGLKMKVLEFLGIQPKYKIENSTSLIRGLGWCV